ncbi:MAG: lycopene cyclase domain-containing protein [Haliscomenobacter sp.]|nr:lycopene cyclase domain-containing protein [Haliscomenobacter sp.]
MEERTRGLTKPVIGLLFLWPWVAVGILWSLDSVQGGQLDFEVPKLALVPWLESRFTYLFLHLFTIVPVFLLSFDRKVHYYTRWRHLAPATLVVGMLFIAWDAFFSYKGVWGFNEEYLTGGAFLRLPWEEWMFFVTVPFGSLFVYECLNAYFPGDPLRGLDKPITLGLAIGLLAVGGVHFEKMYTSTTFILAGGFMLFHFLMIPNTYRTLFYRAFLVILVPFVMINGVLTGGLTARPVVVYNPDEFLGLRLVSIPLEDAVFGFLNLFGILSLYFLFMGKRKAAME